MKQFFNWLLERMKEKTSWVAILTVIGTVFGTQISPEFAEIITGLGLGIVALILFLTKEKK